MYAGVNCEVTDRQQVQLISTMMNILLHLQRGYLYSVVEVFIRLKIIFP